MVGRGLQLQATDPCHVAMTTATLLPWAPWLPSRLLQKLDAHVGQCSLTAPSIHVGWVLNLREKGRR